MEMATVFSPWGNNTTRANYYIFVCPLCCNTIRTECNFLKGFPWDKKVPLFPIFIVQPCLNVYGGIFGWWWDNSCKLLPSLKLQISHRDRLCLRQLIKYFFRVRKEIGWQFDRDFKQFHGLQYLWTTYIFYCVLQYLNISSNSEEKVRFKTYFEELKVSE